MKERRKDLRKKENKVKMIKALNNLEKQKQQRHEIK